MIFSQTVEYALRAAVWLAGNEGVPRTTADIAEGTQVPASYLSKVLQAMSRAGLVIGTRGLHGGFVLARPADGVSVLEVVGAVDPIRRIRECPLGIAAHGLNLCPLHRKLDEAIAHIERSFASTTLGELVAGDPKEHPICPPASLVRK